MSINDVHENDCPLNKQKTEDGCCVMLGNSDADIIMSS